MSTSFRTTVAPVRSLMASLPTSPPPNASTGCAAHLALYDPPSFSPAYDSVTRYSCAMARLRFLVLALTFGCGGGNGTSQDAPVDIDNGTCGTALRFTGEYVDWDNDKMFCGIFNAQVTVQGTGMRSTLPPNGRIDLCVPDQSVTLIDIVAPATPPPCLADKTHNYVLPAIAVADKNVILAGALWHGRNFVEGRETFDVAKAQVYVHVVGPAHAVTLDVGHSHGQAQAVMTDTWAPGNSGHEVFIPDVDPAGGSATLSVEGGAIGTGSIPLVPGKMTTLTVVTH